MECGAVTAGFSHAGSPRSTGKAPGQNQEVETHM